jgi:hypothetical protein
MANWQAVGVITTLALLTESIVEYFVPSFPVKWKWTKMYLAAILAIAVSLAYNADLPAALGLPAVSFVGPILTGLIIGRGSNFIALLWKRGQVVAAPSQSVDNVPQPESKPKI